MRKRQLKRFFRKIYFLVTVFMSSHLTVLFMQQRIAGSGDDAARFQQNPIQINGGNMTPQGTTVEPVRIKWKPRLPHQERVIVQQLPRPFTSTTVRSIVEQKLSGPKGFFNAPSAKGEKKSWENPAQVAHEAQRVGVGEQGAAGYILDQYPKELEQNVSMENGFNGLLSDMISVNRSVLDTRPNQCRDLLYLTKLPTVSVVIPFYNEHFSTLKRTLHSIVNRSPSVLLHEIIIVDDKSDRENLRAPLETYLNTTFGELVRIVRLPERSGLIVARTAGARIATGDVLIFFDSHIECNHNWLPPLLEPIAINRNISTCPIIDSISHKTFEYKNGASKGSRGLFDWLMRYKQMPLMEGQSPNLIEPSPNPVMMGGLFAISREFFWEIGGYDEGLEIWGAEQFEISFKIWMCGGMMFDVPCSRVGHVFRGPWVGRGKAKNKNFVARNVKRVAEVWMDEYKNYIYERQPDYYDKIETGDLTALRAVREKLKCKSFKWYLEEVAPDLLIRFPPIRPPCYATGVLQSMAYPGYCLDKMNRKDKEKVGLYPCANNKTHPQANQHWILSYNRDVRDYLDGVCLDVSTGGENATVLMWECHGLRGNQLWRYDRKLQWLVHGSDGVRCLEAVIEGGKEEVYANMCDSSNLRMKWRFGWVNETAFDKFYNELTDDL